MIYMDGQDKQDGYGFFFTRLGLRRKEYSMIFCYEKEFYTEKCSYLVFHTRPTYENSPNYLPVPLGRQTGASLALVSSSLDAIFLFFMV